MSLMPMSLQTSNRKQKAQTKHQSENLRQLRGVKESSGSNNGWKVPTFVGPWNLVTALSTSAYPLIKNERIQYVSWEPSVSREHELLTGLKRDTQLTFDGSGNSKLQKANQAEPCDTSSEIQVKYALTRRALAIEQENLAIFSPMEAWSEKMMQSRFEQPSSGFARTGVKQQKQTDRKLFIVWVNIHAKGSKEKQRAPAMPTFFTFQLRPQPGCERVWKI